MLLGKPKRQEALITAESYLVSSTRHKSKHYSLGYITFCYSEYSFDGKVILFNIEYFKVCVVAPVGDRQGVLKNVNAFFSSIAIKLFAISACMSKQHCLYHNWTCNLCCHQAAVIFKLACSWLVQKIDRILKRKCLNEQTHSRALRDSMQKNKLTKNS